MKSAFPRWVVWSALAALAGWGGWLRWQGLDRGYEPDEFSMLYGSAAWGVLLDPEVAVNPPLLRFVFDLLFDEAHMMQAGRVFSWAASTAAIVLGGLVARRASGGSAVACLAAAAALAVHPESVRMAANFRSYAGWSLVASWHLLALMRWLDGERRGPRREVVVSGFLMMGLHYLSAPWLVGEAAVLALGRRWRGLVPVLAPLLVALLPVAFHLTGTSETVVRPSEPWLAGMARVVSLHLEGWGALTPALGWKVRPGALASYGPAAAFVTAWLALTALRWRWLREGERVLLGAAVGLIAGVGVIGMLQLVRNPVAICVATAFVPLAASAVPGPAPIAAVVRVGLLAMLFGDAPRQVAADLASPRANGLRDVMADWRRYDAVRAGRPVVLHPQWALSGAYWYLTGRHIRVAPELPECDGFGCFRVEDTLFAGLPRQPRPLHADALVITVEERDPPPTGGVCERLDEVGDAIVWDCRPAAGSR